LVIAVGHVSWVDLKYSTGKAKGERIESHGRTGRKQGEKWLKRKTQCKK
jgi:hypothetical protein